jgi:small subunit ribosomal protein S16
MLIIRFKPQGRKYKKHYRIVVAKKTNHVSKKSVEDIGWYDPYNKNYSIDKERLDHYLKNNIQISESVNSLLKKNKMV